MGLQSVGGTVSILFQGAAPPGAAGPTGPPASFGDLTLDQVVAAVTAGREAYDLEGFFFVPLPDVDSVVYRQEVFRDLDGTPLFDRVRAFGRRMQSMREDLAQADKLRYRYQKERWFLDAVDTYCAAVTRLAEDLTEADLRSKALLALRDSATGYVSSAGFRGLASDTVALKQALADVTYCVHIDGLRVQVSRYDGQPDYSAEVARAFEKFKQGAVKDYRLRPETWPDMNHVEERIHDILVDLYPETFAALDAFTARHARYLDPTIARFDREVQFYVGYLEHIEALRRAGLGFCYPRVSDCSKAVSATDTFDIALAHRLAAERVPVVRNDFFLRDPERIIVVTGPNQGGKTTFARTFGQVNHLAAIGCPVPGAGAALFLFDRMFTHFEKEEDVTTLRGKLHHDLVRIHAVLERATPRSIVIMNEIFTSTTLDDAVFLSTKILEALVDLDALAVCVTFIDELASLTDTTVSMASTVEADNPAVRTYKVVRKPADGLAHAVAIAEKYGLTYERLKERIPS